MKGQSKSPSTGLSEREPTATGSTVPVWIVALMLVVLYLGTVYFDHHSGWFNPKVYKPYASGQELAAYQPRSGAAAQLAHGREVYDQVCGVCHGVHGLGKPNQAPPLAGSQWVNTKGSHRMAHIPLEGLSGPLTVKGQTFNLSMPPMGAALSDQDLAAVLTYIRSAWGNHAGPVSAQEVKAVRAAIGAHPQPLSEKRLKALAP